MSAYQKLKWKKALNQHKFLVEELSLIKSLCKAAAPEFQTYYEHFLKIRDIDLNKLNEDHKEQIKEAYGVEDDITGDVPVIEVGETDLVLSETKIEKSAEIQLSEDEIAIHNLFSKVFKNIALKIHPDKIDPLKHDYDSRREMEKDFTNANSALKNRQYFIIIDIADKYKVQLPKNYEQQTRWMKSQSKTVEDQIENEKHTYNYIFSEAETEEQKDHVIKQFVRQLFGLNL
tara:strand:- start:128 stop:820 length:693 start_codon:yes stop_codon:yes gene_type:complete